MKIAVVGDHDMVLGFLLAGVKLSRTVQNSEETIAALDYFLGHQNVGIILLQESMASGIRAYLAAKIHKKNVYPIILEIEGRKRPDNPGRIPKNNLNGTGSDPGRRMRDHG